MDLNWLLAELRQPLPPGQPRQRALTDRLRHAILQGRLGAGVRLPATRQLAAELAVARNTVLYAYEQLSAEGYLQPGPHGTRVAALALPRADDPAQGAAALPGLSQRALNTLRPDSHLDQGLLPLALAVPELSAFPIRRWRASLDRAWQQASARHLGYAPPGGEVALRQALAAYLSGVRGLAVEPSQVLITTGTQNALDWCARLLADAGDTAWVEDPGYPGARTAFQLAGLRLHGVPVDTAGLAASAADWQAHPPRLIYVTPSHQFPTGAVLPLTRRLALIEQARSSGAWIIEDDYDSEFQPGGPTVPALYGLQPAAPVVYIGTFSKTMFPALRLGYLVVPVALSAPLSQLATQASRPGQSIEQLALADFIQRGAYTAHLRRMRQLYAQRRQALRSALARHFPEGWVTGSDSGLHLMLWWPGTSPSATAVAQAAQAQGIAARPLSRYTLAPSPAQALALGLGATELGLIEGVVERLRGVWEAVRSSA